MGLSITWPIRQEGAQEIYLFRRRLISLFREMLKNHIKWAKTAELRLSVNESRVLWEYMSTPQDEDDRKKPLADCWPLLSIAFPRTTSRSGAAVLRRKAALIAHAYHSDDPLAGSFFISGDTDSPWRFTFGHRLAIMTIPVETLKQKLGKGYAVVFDSDARAPNCRSPIWCDSATCHTGAKCRARTVVTEALGGGEFLLLRGLTAASTEGTQELYNHLENTPSLKVACHYSDLNNDDDADLRTFWSKALSISTRVVFSATSTHFQDQRFKDHGQQALDAGLGTVHWATMTRLHP
jgi:hypothetical protein